MLLRKIILGILLLLICVETVYFYQQQQELKSLEMKKEQHTE
ncbi:hypothetical protein [Candidatus Uabimicrobium sp. HlEnr_7]